MLRREDWMGLGRDLRRPGAPTAILDRLLHHATTLNIKGESCRLKEKRKAGLLEKKAREAAAEETVPPPA